VNTVSEVIGVIAASVIVGFGAAAVAQPSRAFHVAITMQTVEATRPTGH